MNCCLLPSCWISDLITQRCSYWIFGMCSTIPLCLHVQQQLIVLHMIYTLMPLHFADSANNLKITLYDQRERQGIAIPLTESVPDLSALKPTGYEVRSLHTDAGSVWRLYTGVGYTGAYIQTTPPPGVDGSIILSRGYPILMESFIVKPKTNDGSSDQCISLRDEDPAFIQVQSVQRMTAEIILYANDGFSGSDRPLTGSVSNLGSFDDRTSSVIVASGKWRLYTNRNYGGNNAEFVTGNYEDLRGTVGNDSVSAVKLEAYD